MKNKAPPLFPSSTGEGVHVISLVSSVVKDPVNKKKSGILKKWNITKSIKEEQEEEQQTWASLE